MTEPFIPSVSMEILCLFIGWLLAILSNSVTNLFMQMIHKRRETDELYSAQFDTNIMVRLIVQSLVMRQITISQVGLRFLPKHSA